MGETQLDQTARHMIYLVACALHAKAPEPEYLEGLDLERLYRLSCLHSVQSAVCMALEESEAFQEADPAMKKRWQDEKNKAIRKNLLLEAESREIMGYMEEQGIWYAPLKGALLKDMYPRYGMRQMSDVDILMDPAGARQMKKYMRRRGYRPEGMGHGCHDAYHKPPVYGIELHRRLFDRAHNPVWSEYYSNAGDRLLWDSPGSFGKHFSDEDFYIYVVTHACKHHEKSGVGLRALTDCHVYCSLKWERMDRTYISGELEKLGIAEYEHMCRDLAKALFSVPDPDAVDRLTEKQRQELAFVMASGAYGTGEHFVNQRLRRIQPDSERASLRTRFRYCRDRLIPDMDWFYSRMPFCYRHHWAIPFYLVWRVFRGLVLSHRKILNEFRFLRAAGRRKKEDKGL